MDHPVQLRHRRRADQRPALSVALALLSVVGCSAPPHADVPAPSPAPPAVTSPTTAPKSDAPAPMPLAEWDAKYAEVLAACVAPQNGLVDYQAAAGFRSTLTKLADALAAPRTFESRKERLAFLLNAYNVLVIHNVLRRGPVPVLADHKGFYDRDRFTVLGEPVTLDGLRDGIIRPLGDPRAHMALVGGALGDPPLRVRPYDAAELDRQLDDQSRRFIGDRMHNARIGPLLLLSPIFQRFEADFAAPPYGGITGFLRRYAAPASPIGELLHEDSDPPISYQAFNWALNQP